MSASKMDESKMESDDLSWNPYTLGAQMGKDYQQRLEELKSYQSGNILLRQRQELFKRQEVVEGKRNKDKKIFTADRTFMPGPHQRTVLDKMRESIETTQVIINALEKECAGKKGLSSSLYLNNEATTHMKHMILNDQKFEKTLELQKKYSQLVE
mmetsp:Transcript_5999/g.5408  ORF Transcript_5999/g.5408 Transcript_5999/m.5408 type:complete len:155 (-) Transcript_5999:527-991(-)